MSIDILPVDFDGTVTTEGPIPAVTPVTESAPASNPSADDIVALQAEFGQVLARFGALQFDLEKTLSEKQLLGSRIESLHTKINALRAGRAVNS